MRQEFTITLFSEKQEGLINKVAFILTRRKTNINSFSVFFCKTVNLYRFTITFIETELAVQNIVYQMEKIIEVFKCYLQTEAELSTHQILLLKLPNSGETAMKKFSSYKNKKAPDNYRDDNQNLNTFSEETEKKVTSIINAFPIIQENDYCVYTSKTHNETIQQLATKIAELELRGR
jgi:acetolactate synthase-1/3 small subunit